MSKYEVKAVKDHRGHEGERLAQANLYCDGKIVAEYNEGDHGGPCQLFWKDQGAPHIKVTAHSEMGTLCEMNVTPMEGALYLHIKDMTWKGYRGEDMPMCCEVFLGGLVEDYRMAKLCKKKTLCRIKGKEYGPGSWDVFDIKWAPGVRELLTELNGEIEEIYNERLEQAEEAACST